MRERGKAKIGRALLYFSQEGRAAHIAGTWHACSLSPLYVCLTARSVFTSSQKIRTIIDGHERPPLPHPQSFFCVRVCVQDANPDVPSLPAGISTFSMCVSQVEKTCQSNKACTHTRVSCRICVLCKNLCNPFLIDPNHIHLFISTINLTH